MKTHFKYDFGLSHEEKTVHGTIFNIIGKTKIDSWLPV